MTTAPGPDDPAPAATPRVLFTATGVKKHYPGVKALDGVDLEGYAGEVLAKVGLGGLRTNQLARDLGPGQRQMLSLSRAEVTNHKIMILDETTASTS